MSYWKNKRILVTGASSGIGEAFAKQLAAAGANLILSSRQVDKLEALKKSLPNAENHQVLVLDVSNPAQLKSVIDSNAELFENIDVLINNAGISQRALTWEASHESERQIMETNFFGPVVLTKAVLPGMMKRNAGQIINMSSPAGKFGFPLRSSYSASKHAIHGYFDTLRAELHGKNIKVLLACPGRVDTNMSINAVTSDGSKNGRKETRLAGGLSADDAAKIILKAAKKGKAELYIGKEQILIYLNRYLPSAFRAVVSKFNPK